MPRRPDRRGGVKNTIMPDDFIAHPADLAPEQLIEQCDIRFLRRSGPGGQHSNKVSTAVQLRWNVAASASLPDDVKARLRTLARGLRALVLAPGREFRKRPDRGPADQSFRAA